MKNKISSVNFEWDLESIQNFAQHGSTTKSKKTKLKTKDTNKKEVTSPLPLVHLYHPPPSPASPQLASAPASYA